MAFWRQVFDDVAAKHPDVARDYAYVDAMALTMVKKPWTLDVMVTENMFGDILSDLGAGLIGGMGMAPSADVATSTRSSSPRTAPRPISPGRARPIPPPCSSRPR